MAALSGRREDAERQHKEVMAALSMERTERANVTAENVKEKFDDMEFSNISLGPKESSH